MVAVKEDGTGIAGSYEVANNTPANHAGAVWGTSGPVLDGAGNVYATTGNSFSPPPTGNDQSDGALKLSAGAGLLDFFQPPSWRADNAVDLDLGSTWPVFVGTDVFVLGKQRTAFLLAPSSLGGTDHQTPVALSLPNVCSAFGANGVIGGSSIFVACTTGVRQLVSCGSMSSTANRSCCWRCANHRRTEAVASNWYGSSRLIGALNRSEMKRSCGLRSPPARRMSGGERDTGSRRGHE